jgi:thiamine-monophosphate kinase
MTAPRPSEDDLIARYFAPLAGPGGLRLSDDAAVLTPAPGEDMVLTKDALVAGVHFFAGDPPGAIAQKALRVNLSDLAAKGAAPLGFLLGLALPPDWTEDWLAAFARGLGEDAARFACPLLGGDTVKTPGPLTLSVTALGSVPQGRMLRRQAAKPSDRLYVSGTIGDAALGLHLRLAAPQDASWIAALGDDERAHLAARYLLPQPRLALREALRAHASAAMDISDGLVGDCRKLLARAGARIDLALVPLSPAARAAIALTPKLFDTAVTGGDDYEILCAVPPAKTRTFEAAAQVAGVKVTEIGEVLPPGAKPVFLGLDGEAQHFARGSFSHY